MKEKNIEKIYRLRDTIHGDIQFNEKFFSLISTAEFQRLARIKQLSSEYLLFPTATHTRFSHSIGTYYVMKKLTDRLEGVLESHGIAVTQTQKELALCSGLLHDIGHGPFSHTFEAIMDDQAHEEWTVKILASPETEIHQAIIQNFGAEFLEELLDIFNKDATREEDTILSLIHQMISSQMDADRMDYLLRDSYFTGVSTGVFDLDRLIQAIEVDEIENRLQICVSEKYLSSVEEYIMARFYMYKEVYQHPLKRQLENIVLKIFRRVKELHRDGFPLPLDPLIEKIMMKKLDLRDYLALDDHILMYHLAVWRDSPDEILSTLCKAFVDRKKFERYRNQKGESLADILDAELAKKGLAPVHWEEEYAYIHDDVKIPIYDIAHDNIWVKLQSGQLVDVSEASYILQNIDFKNKFERTNEYFHRSMMENKFGKLNL